MPLDRDRRQGGFLRPGRLIKNYRAGSAGGNCLRALNSAHQLTQTPRSLSDLAQLHESFAAA
jgi:hypothetical protein